MLHHGGKGFKEAVDIIDRRILVHDGIKVNVSGLVLKAGGKAERYHGYTATRSFLTGLLIVKGIEPVSRETPD